MILMSSLLAHLCRHGGDMAGAGARRARWNAALLCDGVAPAYLALLGRVAAERGPGQALYE